MSKSFKNPWKPLLVGCAYGLVALSGLGCRRSVSAEYDLSKQWSIAVRNLGIQPIFPPREDIQVGDIYFSRIQPDEENTRIRERGYVPLDLWVANMDLQQEINAFYKGRFLFPETASYNQAGGYLDRSYFDEQSPEGRPERRMMRLVSFPIFATTTVVRHGDHRDLYRFVPPEILNYFLREGSYGLRGVSVGASMAESYGLPVDAVYKKFAKEYHNNDDLAKLINAMRHVERGGDDRRVVTGDQVKYCWSYNFYVKLITEVYTVRNLDVVFRFKPSTDCAVDGYGPSPNFPGLNLTRLNQMLAKNIYAANSGGHMRFVSMNQDSIGLRQTYARPIVVGYRGVLIRINSIDRTAEMMGVIDSKPHLHNWKP